MDYREWITRRARQGAYGSLLREFFVRTSMDDLGIIQPACPLKCSHWRPRVMPPFLFSHVIKTGTVIGYFILSSPARSSWDKKYQTCLILDSRARETKNSARVRQAYGVSTLYDVFTGSPARKASSVVFLWAIGMGYADWSLLLTLVALLARQIRFTQN